MLDTSTLVVLPLEASSLLASSATSSDNTATTESTESTSLQPMTDVSNTLIYATKQTGILKPATSSLNWGISIKDISGTSLVEVKDRKTVAPVAQLKHSRNISWSVRSSIASRKIYETATSVTEATKHEEASRVTDRKSDGIKPSISSGSKSDQSSILVVRSTYTGLIRETSSLAQSNHVISQTTHVTPATQSEIIQPTKASVESKEISSLTQITQVEKTTTKEPPDTTEEPDVQVTEGKDSPPPGKMNNSLWVNASGNSRSANVSPLPPPPGISQAFAHIRISEIGHLSLPSVYLGAFVILVFSTLKNPGSISGKKFVANML